MPIAKTELQILESKYYILLRSGKGVSLDIPIHTCCCCIYCFFKFYFLLLL
jgi:hypothetical protein